MKIKYKSGFSLIELLVVIAIIALIIAITLPSLARVKLINQDLKCKNNLRSLGTACEVYNNDFRSFPLVNRNPSIIPKLIDIYPVFKDYLTTNTMPFLGVKDQPWFCEIDTGNNNEIFGSSYLYYVGLFRYQKEVVTPLNPQPIKIMTVYDTFSTTPIVGDFRFAHDPKLPTQNNFSRNGCIQEQ